MNDMNLSIDAAITTHIDQNSSCFFTQKYHLLATDLVETINLPAVDFTVLNEKIQLLFQKLKQVPDANPILIGAIPFDTTQPSCLNIYGQHQKQDQLEIAMNAEPISLKIAQRNALVEADVFAKSIDSAKQHFSNKTLEKIVLSQAVDFNLHHPHDPYVLAATLAKKNPHAYSFVVPVENQAFLLGASPELLLAKHGQHVRSNPLAGSRPLSQDAEVNQSHIDDLYASSKDLHEHQIVVDSVFQHLRPFCEYLKVSPRPEILSTTTMLHLSTVFDGRLDATDLNALQIALALHPTPAICGSPTQLAKDFILENEGYDRHYYAGLVGWMDAEGNGEWVVTIRCGLLENHQQPQNIRLYAGAGIVTGSDATSEWNETEAKMQTLLKTLNAEF